MSSRDNRIHLSESGSINKLVNILRQAGDPAARIEAARELAKMDDQDVVEALIGAALNDPDETVQETARQLVREKIGFQADLVFSFAGLTGFVDQDWLLPAHDPEVMMIGVDGEENPGMEDGENWVLSDSEWEDLYGLTALAKHDRNQTTRLRAIHVLGKSRDMSATYVLAELALWDPDEGIRTAAFDAIESTFGDNTDQIVEEIRREMMGEDEDIHNVQDSPNKPSSYQQTPGWNLPSNSPAIQDVSTPKWFLLVVFLILAGGFLFILLR